MLSARKYGNRLTVGVDFELDQHHADIARNELEALLADTSITHLTLDLSGMRFMDSSGIGFILGRVRTLERRGGRVAVTGISPHVDRILKMSGIYKVLDRASGEANRIGKGEGA